MLRVKGLSAVDAQTIKDLLSVANPKRAQARRFAGWASNDIPKYLVGFVPDADDLLIAPGAGAAVWSTLRQLGYLVTFGSPEPTITPFGEYLGELRPEQHEAMDALGSRRQGYVLAPCGSGKTELGIALIHKRGVRALVIVHTQELLHQWKDRIEKRLGFKPALLGGGHKRNADFTSPVIVGTVQWLRANSVVLQTQLADRELVMVDEAHHTPATTFTEVLAKMAPVYRYGLTATDVRADGLTPMLEWWIGPKLAEIKRSSLEAAGSVIRPHLRVIGVGCVLATVDSNEPGDYTRMMKALVEDKDRLRYVCSEIERLSAIYGHHLVLASWSTYAAAITERIVGAELVTGKTPKKQRVDTIRRFQEGQIPVLVATTLADEGLDVTRITDLWLTMPTRSAAKTEQRVGRAARSHPGKMAATVHDFVDVGVVSTRGGEATGRLLVNQFMHRFNAVYKRVCDYDDREIATMRALRRNL